MPLIPAVLFAVSANLDNFVIGLSYGMKRIHIPILSNLMISLVIFCSTFLSMALSRSLAGLFPVRAADVLGSVMMILLGLYCLLGFVLRNRRFRRKQAVEDPEWPTRNPEKYDRDASHSIEFKEAFALGLALAVNNIGLGIGAGVSGLPMLATSLASLLCSFLFLCLGNRIGNSWLSNAIGRFAEPLSGLVILALGIYELF